MKTATRPPRPPAPRGYHHGDLRNALLQAGLKLIETRAADDLGLREVAREVGVSATAIYRHFPDKQALKAALAQAGIEQLGQAQRLASQQAGGGRAGFLASGLTYVRFAADHPVLFRLIFQCVPATDMLDAAPSSVSTALRGLRDDIAGLMPAGSSAAQRKAGALRAWALVHGLALLLLDQQIPADWGLIEQVLKGFDQPLGPPPSPPPSTPARPKPAPPAGR